MSDALLVAAALFNFAFGVFHLFFWKLFGWKSDLARLRAVNRGIVPVLNLALAFMFALVGLVMLADPPSRLLVGAMVVFWLFRAALQPPYFGLEHWLSKLMMVLFVAGAIVHAAAWWMLPGG